VTMPPIPTRYQGRDAIARIFERHVFAPGRGEFRSVRTRANRQPAFGLYRKLPGESAFTPRVLEVLRIDGDRIAAIEAFVYPELFPAFGLPSSV